MYLGAEPLPGDALLAPVKAQLMRDVHARMSQLVESMKKDMNQAMIARAATSIGVNLAISAIPIVGQAAAFVAGVVQAVAGSGYETEAKAILGQAEADVATMQAQTEARIQSRLALIYREEKEPAIKMALQPGPLEGLGGIGPRNLECVNYRQGVSTGAEMRTRSQLGLGSLGFSFSDAWGRFSDTVERGASNVEDVARGVRDDFLEAGRMFERELIRPAAHGVRSYVGGRIVKEEAREKADELRSGATKALSDYESAVYKHLDDPNFRAALRVELAKYLRQDPQVQQMLARLGESRSEYASASHGAWGFVQDNWYILAGGGIGLLLLAGLLGGRR